MISISRFQSTRQLLQTKLRISISSFQTDRQWLQTIKSCSGFLARCKNFLCPPLLKDEAVRWRKVLVLMRLGWWCSRHVIDTNRCMNNNNNNNQWFGNQPNQFNQENNRWETDEGVYVPIRNWWRRQTVKSLIWLQTVQTGRYFNTDRLCQLQSSSAQMGNSKLFDLHSNPFVNNFKLASSKLGNGKALFQSI